MKHLCPVCGYDGLNEPPYDIHGSASFEICPCCGTEFGYQDATVSHAILRQRWIDGGMHWSSDFGFPPEGWNPVEQLRKAKLIQ